MRALAHLAPTLDGVGTWLLLGGLLVAGWLHESGRLVLRRRSVRRRVPGRRVAAFWGGLALVVVAVASPLEGAADRLLSAHMVQHLVLGLLAPLLLVLAVPAPVMAESLGRRGHRRLVRLGRRIGRATGLQRVAVATGLLAVAAHVGVWVVWHVPPAYDLAVHDPLVHDLEHLTMFAAGVGLWWVVQGVQWRNRSGLAIVYLFLAGLPLGALSAIITLTPTPLYDAHRATAPDAGLTPLADQQLAGVIMWVPGGAIYLIAAAALFVAWLAAGPTPREGTLLWHA